MEKNQQYFGKNIEFSIKRRIAIIKLNRTHRSNSFTIPFLTDLENALDFCQHHEKVKVIILTAYGTSFSTGMDLGEITKYDYKDVKELERRAASICKILYNGKPVICAINGRTLGEGVVFLTCCDYRIAVQGSFFQMPEINSAIFPGTGCITLFSKIIGISWTKKMLMFAERVDTQKAFSIGLIDEIVDDKILLTAAIEKAKFLSTKNQTVLNAIKILTNHLHNRKVSEAYKLEKIGSDWYRFPEKAKFLAELKENFEWTP
jgi:enoyl-CoA hydratase/carnithine racemase